MGSIRESHAGLEHGHQMPDRFDPGRIVRAVAGGDDDLVDQCPRGPENLLTLARLVGDATNDVDKPGARIDVVQLRRDDERIPVSVALLPFLLCRVVC